MRVAGVVPQRPGNLLRQPVVQPIDQVAHVIRDVAQVQALAAAIPGVDDLLEVFDRFDHHLVVGQRAMPQMIDLVHLGIGLHDAVGQLGKLFFQSNVGRHGNCS